MGELNLSRLGGAALRGGAPDVGAPALLSVRGLSKRFEVARSAREVIMRQPVRYLQALRDVSLDLAAGETLGVVGESGCGKSTLARCLVGLEVPNQGEIFWQGQPMPVTAGGLAQARKVQMVFQDPYASLNPRMSLGAMLEEVLNVHEFAASRAQRNDRVDELLTIVGLPLRFKQRMPHSLSGGQRQRISIARALAVRPQIVIADEPVSALDASVQAQIIKLLEDLREQLKIAIIFISHDLNVIRHISDRVAVMYLGQIVETGATDAVFGSPLHPYTRALLLAIPSSDPAQRSTVPALAGELPDPVHPPPGCGFSSRCPWVVAACQTTAPELIPIRGQGMVRCSNDKAVNAAFAGPLPFHSVGEIHVLPK